MFASKTFKLWFSNIKKSLFRQWSLWDPFHSSLIKSPLSLFVSSLESYLKNKWITTLLDLQSRVCSLVLLKMYILLYKSNLLILQLIFWFYVSKLFLRKLRSNKNHIIQKEQEKLDMEMATNHVRRWAILGSCDLLFG